MSDAVLVACLGNVFRGDDGFGVEVARALLAKPPRGARVVDFGVRGHDLAFALCDARAAVLVDVVARGGAPGTLYVIEPERGGALPPKPQHGHSLDPAAALALAGALGGAPARLRLIGCEPLSFGGEDGAVGLSAPVAAAVPEAARLAAAAVEDLIKEGACTRPA